MSLRTRSARALSKGAARPGSAKSGSGPSRTSDSSQAARSHASSSRPSPSSSASSQLAARPSPGAIGQTSSSLPSEKYTKNARANLIRPIRIIPRNNAALTAPPLKPPRLTKRQRALDPPSNNPPSAREQQLSRTYALEAVPPPTALAALGNRISADLLGVRAERSSSSRFAKGLEQCCTCKSFWEVVAEEEALQESVARQQEADGVPAARHDGAVTEKRYTNYLDAERLDNESLSVLGNSLLGTFAAEWLEARYPHLPERAMKAALTLYVGPRTCADIASRSWGITSGSASRTAFLGAPPALPVNSSSKHTPGHPLRGVGEGGRSGMGLLRWGKSAQSALDAVTRRQGEFSAEKDKDSAVPLPLEEALASAARAIVGLIYQEHGFAAVRQFVHAHFLSRQADLLPILKFFNPRYTLQATVQKHGLESPITRLVAETGRLSISPIFVVGVWSGTTKLGEGYGSSLKMAEWRACEDALRRIYLSPSQNPVKDIAGAESADLPARHALELPTDTLVIPGSKLRQIRPLADEEVLYHSAGRTGIVCS